MKAQIGDYIKKDGQPRQVLDIDEAVGTYFTDDGGAIGDDAINGDDVFLPSEIEENSAPTTINHRGQPAPIYAAGHLVHQSTD